LHNSNLQYIRKDMKRNYFLLIISVLSFCISGNVIADSTSTTYSGGSFKTHCELPAKMSKNITLDVADYLVDDFHNSPGHLFTWALKDLGLQNSNNELIIIFKSSSHDNKTGITHGVFDIVVPHFTTFSNIKVDAIVSKSTNTNGTVSVNAKIIYSSLLLKNAQGNLTFIPQRNNNYLLVSSVTINFGWFFNFFITQKRYKSIVEWRIKKFIENIKQECDKRQEKEMM
jgi:hypothetical protein